MFVIIDISAGNGGYCAFGETLKDAVESWEFDCDSSPNLLDSTKTMIVVGAHKVPKVTYVNAPKQKKTVEKKK